MPPSNSNNSNRLWKDFLTCPNLVVVKEIMIRVPNKLRMFLHLHKTLQLMKPFSTHWIQIILLLHYSIYTCFLWHIYGPEWFNKKKKFVYQTNLKASMIIPQRKMVNSHYKYAQETVTCCIQNISMLTKYNNESQLLQYTSHIWKFWFVIVLKFSKILIVKVIIWFVNHELLFQTLY